MQLVRLTERTHVASELFFFHDELWAENNNPQYRHTRFAISKANFSEKLYITQKIIPHKCFEAYEQDQFQPFSICSFKSSLEF